MPTVKILCAQLPHLNHLGKPNAALSAVHSLPDEFNYPDLSKCFELTHQILFYLPTSLKILNLCGVRVSLAAQSRSLTSEYKQVHELKLDDLRIFGRLQNLEILDLKACWRLGSLYNQQNPFIVNEGSHDSYFSFSYNSFLPPSVSSSPFGYLQYLPRLHTLILSTIYCLADNDIAALPAHLQVLDISFCLHISNAIATHNLLPTRLKELYCLGCDSLSFAAPTSSNSDTTHHCTETAAPCAAFTPPKRHQHNGRNHSPRGRPSDDPSLASGYNFRVFWKEWAPPDNCCIP